MMSFSKDKMAPLKAVMALFIVAAHLTYNVDSPVLRPFREMGAPIVSLFLAISGYGLIKSFETKGNAYIQGFFRKRVLKIVIPAIGALVLFYIFLWSPQRNLLDDMRNTVLLGSPPLPQLWYVITILFMYILFWMVYRWLPKGLRLPALTVGALLFGVGTYMAGYGRNWWVCCLSFPAGAWFARFEKSIFSFCEKSILRTVAVLCALIGSGLFFYLTGKPEVWPLCYVFIPWVAMLLVSILPLDKLNGRAVGFLGAISYEIYLCHEIPLEFFHSPRIHIDSDMIYIILVYAVTILLAWLLHISCNLVKVKA